MSIPNLSLNDLLGLAQDLDDGFEHRSERGAPPTFVLDANVVWMLQNANEAKSMGYGGSTAKTLGEFNATSLMRWSLDRVLETKHELSMLEAHKYEVDVAFAERHEWDYENLVDALEDAIKEARERHRAADDRFLAREVVKNLKEKFANSYIVLTDVLDRNRNITRFNVVKPNRKIEEIPRSLQIILRSISDILRSGDMRPAFSVYQDVKALRDLACINATSSANRTVLITRDKKLLDAVRVCRSLDEQWSDYILVESLDTFWIWLAAEGQGEHRHEGLSPLRNVLDDYRARAKKIFLRDQESRRFSHVWISNPSWLEKFASEQKTGELKELQVHVKDLLERQKDTAYPSEDLGDLRTRCAQFFEEVRQMLPTLQVVSLHEADRADVLETALINFQFSAEAFFKGLDDDIQEHANQSLRILGAATMLAPRILGAIEVYRSNRFGAGSPRSFIHRLPVPIQSDDFDLEVIVKLVSNSGEQRGQRFDRLLKMRGWQGPIADLVISYLLVHAGDWEEARRICSTSRSRNFALITRNSPLAYEMMLLEAAILRIYKTNDDKLNQAEDLLNQALAIEAPRPQADRGDLRILMEKIAVGINRILLRKYRANLIPGATIEPDPWTEEYQDIFDEMLRLKVLISDMQEGVLREKLSANANVNILLLSEFIARLEYKPNSHIAEALLKVREEGVRRLSSRETFRISYFEEIVVAFAILSRDVPFEMDSATEIDLRSALRAKLARVLQRRDQVNEFEYWIFRDVNVRVQQLEILA